MDATPSNDIAFAELASSPAPAAEPQTVSVLHVINGEHFAGAERVQDLLARALPQFGYDVAFACTKPDRFPEARHYKDAPIYNLPARGFAGFRAAGQLADIVREHDYKIIHAHTPRSVAIASLASYKTGVPLVYHVHSPTSRDTTRRFRNWINNVVEKFSLRNAKALITVSHSLAKHMRGQGFDDERLHVVPNGVPVVDVDAFETPPTESWTLGTMALFRPRKGTEVLLEALAMLFKRGFDVRLNAVGPFETPEYGHRLQSLAKKLDVDSIVDWKGFASDVNRELNEMDLFVLPSLFGEGLPMVVLEAMACGVPVVGTAVEGVPEAVRNGEDGVIAEPNDSVDLANQIEQILRGKLHWQSMRRSAIERQRSLFSDNSMAEGVAKVYDGVLGDA